ncbi:MAG: hypothetical protein A3D92_21690 [Bacteroidetes bacterium RIFCSPHIGHO2_02_FULL_44_7]|nr:MAG: hypothetical protein A3D92_21690 [Bacteroidetes bacterium RIFCSPHIGHO2_02_FULL_44_7]
MKKLLSILTLTSALSFGQNPLLIPPTIESSSVQLALQEGTTQFYPGITTATMGANGSLLGPTLIFNQGDNVSIAVNNQLTEPTTIHWHGMHVPSMADGGPHTVILAGDTWTPQFTVLDRAGINWYHPHLHMQTNKHVSRGIAGLILVKDPEEAALVLPRDYGIDDFPMVLQTKGFDGLGQIEWMSHMDTSVMVNGTVDPILETPAQVVRFRILNGSSQRVYELGLSNNQAFQLIGTDGGLLTAPVQLTRYRMAPGQRADVLVDLSGLQGQTIQWMSYGSELPSAIYGAAQPGMMAGLTLPGYASNVLNGSDFVLLDLTVVAPTAMPITTIPSVLSSMTPLLAGTENTTRNLTFTTQQNIVGPFLINGAGFDMNVINYTIPLGNREIWSLTNQTPIAHPFHIHDVQFYILDINGVAPPPALQGLNDVVLVPAGMGNVRFITEFLDFADDEVPYMYHCHMLQHEDEGMMGQFIVYDPLGLEEATENRWSVYPNPSNTGSFTLNSEGQSGEFQVTDALGRKIMHGNTTGENTSFTLTSGNYLLHFLGAVKWISVR